MEAEMATQTGYKVSELGMIPQDWDVVELGKVCDIDTENLTSNTDSDYEFDYISLEQIDNGHLLNTEKYKFKDAPSRARRVVRKNDVLISTVRPNLMSHYYVKNEVRDLICSTGFSVVRGTNKLNMPYLYHHLFANIINSQINLVVVGSNYPAINSHDIKNLKIPLPSTPEQTAIATALSDTDALISSLQTLIAKKKAIKLSAMQNLLSGKIRLPEFAQRPDGSPKTTRQTELGCVPEDWAVVELGDVGKTYGGLSGKNKSDFDRGDSFYVPFTNVMANLEVDKNQLGKVEVNEKQNAVLEGDLLFNGSSETPEEVCFASFVNFSLPNLFLNSFCFGFRLTKNTISPKYLAYWFRSEIGRKTIAFMSQGSTRYNISKSEFVKLKLVMPSKPEQTAIAQLLSDMDAEIESLEGRLKKTQSLKQGMMQALLTGKIRLPLE